ncbi:MAG TPA: prephenate dehydratase [Polyangiales bacterium]|nr:prephenate dehydratase [Polyangiales bacterium]
MSEPRQVLVGYQGTDGAYSQIAAEQHFAAQSIVPVTRGYESFAGLLAAVAKGEVQYAMQPIENTTAGSINEAYDLLARMDLHLIGEEVLRVQHCLLGLPGSKLENIRRVFSHPQALAQCSEALGAMPNCAVQAFTDTAMSVTKVRDEADPSQAAVASERAGQLYGLSVLSRAIANQEFNYTRFVVVAPAPRDFAVGEACKTSLIFTTKHERGALVRCLNILADADLNLTKLESRPRPETPWEYLFYVDFEGNKAEPKVREALAGVEQQTTFFKLLGSYPMRTRRSGLAP